MSPAIALESEFSDSESDMIRDDIKTALVTAMKAGDKPATGAIRLIQAAIKNRDIEARTGKAPDSDDALVVEVLQKMVKQRRESIDLYAKGGRQELADAEAAEVAVIERFLPAQMSADATRAAIESIKAELGATGMKDMGRVMAELKARHGTELDMSQASALVKGRSPEVSLTPAFLDELRARTLLSALIGRSVKIQRAGREWKACCPFHQEKTPSFTINDDKGFYHCFGCGAHGDAIKWMTDQRGLSFIDAVKELAQAAGLDMPEQDRQSAERAERAKGLHEAMEDAARWFSDKLYGIEGTEARGILQGRGIREETARAFGLGFAPDSRGKLRQALATYGDPLLIEAGLLIKVEEKEPYDRFRGRLMIPIRDPRGRAIAFGGRVIGDGEPKYLNSPDTPLFDKGHTLYNLDRAQPAARKSGRVIAVEGYMDVIALAQAGFEEAVAPLGTALTEHQLARLWRIADVPPALLRRRRRGPEGRAARRPPRAPPARARSQPSLRHPARRHGPRRPRPRQGRRRVRDAAPQAPAARRPHLGARACRRAARDARGRAGLRRRLSTLAQTIAEPSVRQEYLSEFRRRFDVHFAAPPREFRPRGDWKKGKWKPPEAPVGAIAKGVNASGLDPMLARAVLAGLIRHPAEIARHMEVLGSLRKGSGALARLFEAVIDVALEDRQLDSAGILTILARSGFDTVASDLLRADALPFSFARPDTGDEARAREDLGEAIAVMVAQPAVDAALAEATAAVAERFTDEAFAVR